jgi:hypothetical protein
MATNTRLLLGLLISTQLLYSCIECKSDRYGDVLELELPVEIALPADTLDIGDTITISLEFDKEVMIYQSDETIRLDSFNFFAEFGISEISGVQENFSVNIEVIEYIGSVDQLPLVVGLTYPIMFEESTGGYNFLAKIVLRQAGKFYFRIDSANELFERYNHPAVFRCNKDRRREISVSYTNPQTSEDEFYNIFQASDIDYFTTIYDYEQYSRLGARTFVVRE